MRIALTGTTGRVGAALVRRFSASHEVVSLPRRVCDLADAGSLKTALDRLECDMFINPAGETSLENCEDDPSLAMRVNAEAPAEIASWAADRGVPVIHFSTDYVFSGEVDRLCGEAETPSPVNAYARSKLAGEQAVLAYPANCVVRVSWVFGPDKASFIDQIFDVALAGQPLAAVADKFSLPVFTEDLAEWMECLVERKTTGIIHACNSGDPITWHDMAMAVVEEMAACGILSETPDIRKQSLSEITFFRAVRPRFTAMKTHRLTEILGHAPRPWQNALTEHVRRRCQLL
jgi:dTDP-4-dehydrorhamnose reductase